MFETLEFNPVFGFRYLDLGFPDSIPLLVDTLHDFICHHQRFRIPGFPRRVDAHHPSIYRRDADKLIFRENHVAFAIKAREDTPNITLFVVNIHIGGDEGDHFEG